MADDPLLQLLGAGAGVNPTQIGGTPQDPALQAPDASSAPPTPPPDLGSQQAAATPQLAPQGYQGPRPILMDLIQGMISPKMQAPGPGQMARPVSRAATFEDFLGNFIGALGQGFAASGHGPGAFARGFGAAATAPLQQQQQRAQFAQQQQAGQAQIESEQAKTAQTQAQTGQIGQTVTLPNGMTLPAKVAEQYLKGTQAAEIGAASRISVAQLKTQVMTGQVGQVKPSPDGGWMAYNKFGKPLGKLEGSVNPEMLNKFSTSEHFDKDADGNIVAIPTTTVSGRVPPAGGAAPTAGSIGGPALFPGGPARTTPTPRAGAGGARVITAGKSPTMVVGSMPDGRQVSGAPSELNAAGATGITQLPADEAKKVVVARQLTSPGGLFDLADKDLQRFKPGELEQLGPRWNEFMAGTYGTADSRYIALRTHVNGLLSTALMQAHVGARGSSEMMEHFQDIANAGKMSKETLASALNAERQYVEEKAMRPNQKLPDMVDVQIPGQPKGSIHRSQLDNFRQKYPAAKVF